MIINSNIYIFIKYILKKKERKTLYLKVPKKNLVRDIKSKLTTFYFSLSFFFGNYLNSFIVFLRHKLKVTDEMLLYYYIGLN